MKIHKNMSKILLLAIFFTNIPMNSFAYYKKIENQHSNELHNFEKRYLSNKFNKNSTDSKQSDIWVEGLAGVSEVKNALRTIGVDGKIYSIGGYDGTTRLNTVEEYDPKTDTWTIKTPMPTGRSSFGISEIDGKIYCIGGQGSSNLNVVEVYDPKTDTWDTSKTPMPTARRDFKSFILDEKIYCIGGNNGSYLNTVEVYDPKTDTWDTSKAPMPIAVGRFEGEVFENKIYCISGLNSSQTKAVQVYDATTDSWEFKTDIPTARTNFGSAIIEGKIYCIGGTSGNHLNLVEVYDIKTDTWETKTPMPTARNGFGTAFLDGKIYCIAGYNGSRLTTVEMYIPEEYQEYEVKVDVSIAEQSGDISDIELARDKINKLPEGDLKRMLQARLNSIVPNITLERKSSTANLDIYIKSENMLSMSLSTNSITFENFSGVDELVKDNALEISINSSLPYELNAYMPTEIKSIENQETMDIDTLNIKDNSNLTDSEYKEFESLNTKLTLNSHCDSGNNKKHNIDLKLKGGNAYPASVYKTTIKFEAQQK